jgi:hypothetical protein
MSPALFRARCAPTYRDVDEALLAAANAQRELLVHSVRIDAHRDCSQAGRRGCRKGLRL